MKIVMFVTYSLLCKFGLTFENALLTSHTYTAVMPIDFKMMSHVAQYENITV